MEWDILYDRITVEQKWNVNFILDILYDRITVEQKWNVNFI